MVKTAKTAKTAKRMSHTEERAWPRPRVNPAVLRALQDWACGAIYEPPAAHGGGRYVCPYEKGHAGFHGGIRVV